MCSKAHIASVHIHFIATNSSQIKSVVLQRNPESRCDNTILPWLTARTALAIELRALLDLLSHFLLVDESFAFSKASSSYESKVSGNPCHKALTS